jgi:very-short-patch-repair endonuclease
MGDFAAPLMGDASAADDPARQRVLDQVDVWRKELINLTRRNRLLYFRHTKTSTLEISLDPHGFSTIPERLLRGEPWQFYFPPEAIEPAEFSTGQLWAPPSTVGAARKSTDNLVTTKTESRALHKALRNLHRRATQEFMDKGIWILYLAAGILRWADPDTKEAAESPLILIPVHVDRDNPREAYELRPVQDEDIVFNPALEVRLGEFGVSVPGVDDADPDIEAMLDAVELAVAEREGWEVQRRLVISPFSFHKEVMFRDLKVNEEEVAGHRLVRALALGAKEGSELDFDPIPEDRLDEESPPEDLATILDADATQRQCIAAARAGRSFVIDGPPGTGKSQTIANVIAELLACGRTVLFVSEKAAALDVVHKRLKQAGLGDYALELHSHKAGRKEVAKKLGDALERHPVGPSPMPSADVTRLAARRVELTRRADAMNVVRQPLGLSLHDVIGKILGLQSFPPAPTPEAIGSSLSAPELSEIDRVAGELSRAWGPVERGDDFLWRDLKDARPDAGRQRRTSADIKAAETALQSVTRASDQGAQALHLPAPEGFQAAETLLDVLRLAAARPIVPESWLTATSLEHVNARSCERRQMVAEHGQATARLAATAGARWREIDPSAASQFQTSVQKLQSEPLRLDLPGDLDAGAVAGTHKFVVDSASFMVQARSDGETVARAFGLSAAGLTLDRVDELADLAELAGMPDRPESEWVDPIGVKRVRRAVAALQPLCAAIAQQQSIVGSVFNSGVLDLDLDGLCARLEHDHKGLGKLKAQYRVDKKAIAAATHGGSAKKDAIRLLPQALEWRRLRGELRAVESKHAAAVGENYYQGVDTDFDVVSNILDDVDRAISLAGPDVDLTATRRQLSTNSVPEPELPVVGARLRSRLDDWRSQAKNAVPLVAGRLGAGRLDASAAWCTAAATPLGQLADVAGTIFKVTPNSSNLSEAASLLEARLMAHHVEESLARTLEDDEFALGPLYQGVETDWDALAGALEWATGLRELFAWPLNHRVASSILHTTVIDSDLSAALERWRRARDVVCDNFLEPRLEELGSDLEATFTEAHGLLATLRDSVVDIDEWAEFTTAREKLAGLGVGDVVGFCEGARVAAEAVPRVVERACLEAWVDTVIDEDMDRLGSMRADQLDPLVREFRRLDVSVIDHAASRVIRACNARRPRTSVGAVAVIKHQAKIQRKHMPVRRLLAVAGEAAQALNPCFMMSPLTVSHFLPPSLKFDAVIFDEASQVRPSDAINCVYRGRHLIVAGDEQQLPPTSFFESVAMEDDDEWEEGQFEDFQSILDLCNGFGGLRGLPLRWHYRSQHEDLINYSNHAFYDGRLITFPGATSTADDLGVKFFHVANGEYRRGASRDNPHEADAVVDRVMHWAGKSLAGDADLTVGVVAFSEAQASAIEAALERRRREAPEFDDFFRGDRLDGFFVKNLESVQGDERDIMIFSVGYGRDEHGKLTMNFGPLNREGGQRRLNVAITRARRLVEVVASITGTEPEFRVELAQGVRHLQRYLDYAARGPIALALDVSESGFDAESPFEEEVIRSIRSWGYEVVPQVGTAGYRVDIGVRSHRSGQFALGVECDGRMYHSSRVARDRDRIRQEVLEARGWRIYRIWSTAWYRNRSEQEQRLRVEIASAISASSSRAAVAGHDKSPTPSLDVGIGFEVVALDDTPEWTTPYRLARPTPPPLGPTQSKLQMHTPEARVELSRMIMEVVDVEGPIQDGLLLERIRESWGVGRAGSRIRDNLRRTVDFLTQRGEVQVAGRFIELKGQTLETVRVPGSDPQASRTVAEVPPAELELAVQNVLADAHGGTPDELTLAVALLFGWNRRGPDIAAALDAAVDALVRQGHITEDGDRLSPASRDR